MGIYEGPQKMVVRTDFHDFDIVRVVNRYDTRIGSGSFYLRFILIYWLIM